MTLLPKEIEEKLPPLYTTWKNQRITMNYIRKNKNIENQTKKEKKIGEKNE